MSGCKDGEGEKRLTLTRVRMTITDWITPLIGMAISVSLKAVRVSISLLSASVVADWGAVLESRPPTAQGSEVAMVWADGRWGVGASQ